MTTAQTRKDRFQISPTLASFIAGTFGGLAGVVAGHPFDTIKVRLQSQIASNTKYKGTLHCFLTILKEEKLFGFYKGITSPLFGVAVVNALLFGVYGAILQLQMGSSYYQPDDNAGSGSGLVNSIVSSPMELVKIQLQNQGSPLTTAPKYNMVQCINQIYKMNGVRGLFRGLNATILRDTPSYGAYFVAYEVLCRKLAPDGTDPKDLSGVRLMLAGGLGGIIGWSSTYPYDVVKTVIQADTSITQVKSSQAIRTNACFKDHYNGKHGDGTSSLFRGFWATVLRAFPTNVAILSTWHLSMTWFRQSGLLTEEQ